MILFISFIYNYNIDLILNKKILIRSIPYNNFIIGEDISDFSQNVFHTKNLQYSLQGINKISLIEKEGEKYKIKIGNYYICHDKSEVCNYLPDIKKCMDKNFSYIDCDVCKNKLIKLCDKNPELWDIERTVLGYTIKQNDKCLTLGYKIFLDDCKESKDQLFGFENYELMSCIENFDFNKIPSTRKEEIDLLKMKKLLKDIEKQYPEKIKNLKKENAEDVLESLIPLINSKPKMKKLWGSLNMYKMKGFKFPNNFKFKMLCGKWW